MHPPLTKVIKRNRGRPRKAEPYLQPPDISKRGSGRPKKDKPKIPALTPKYPGMNYKPPPMSPCVSKASSFKLPRTSSSDISDL